MSSPIQSLNTPISTVMTEVRTRSFRIMAGVIGRKKFIYDVWGDTVNLAARMESSGETGKVNISRHTYELVQHHFDCEYRGKIVAKNKGSIDMYFVHAVKT